MKFFLGFLVGIFLGAISTQSDIERNIRNYGQTTFWFEQNYEVNSTKIIKEQN